MKEEYDALMKNETWSLVPRASNTNVVDGKWVYRLKWDKNGAITRYKARFVAKGFRQQLGIDFHETFSPVVKSTTFLHENLKEQVYMEQPPGFIDPQRPNHVCLLHKSLYGLKQAPRAWFERLSKALFDLGNNKGTIDNIICQLGSAFALKDLGPLNYFLVKYRQVVGSLQYVTLSRPDIVFAVNKVIPILLLKLSVEIHDRRSTGGFAIYLGSNLIS
ncbi:putative RNA-directed DNA polymerase [Tanacetum coccineum]|uniref:RNA-directed DNA polymerase n=1 Tax=Tanacetum coccineum TaxID=301880 RepID=A0ABQ4ZTA6_9ASTR